MQKNNKLNSIKEFKSIIVGETVIISFAFEDKTYSFESKIEEVLKHEQLWDSIEINSSFWVDINIFLEDENDPESTIKVSLYELGDEDEYGYVERTYENFITINTLKVD